MFKLIEFMSGKFTRDLQVCCNVLIANDVTHVKYQVGFSPFCTPSIRLCTLQQDGL